MSERRQDESVTEYAARGLFAIAEAINRLADKTTVATQEAADRMASATEALAPPPALHPGAAPRRPPMRR